MTLSRWSVNWPKAVRSARGPGWSAEGGLEDDLMVLARRRGRRRSVEISLGLAGLGALAG